MSGTFEQDYRRLTKGQRAAFKRALSRFIEDLKPGGGFRPGLRVKRVLTVEGAYEMTWAGDGRATFNYGSPVRPGDPHYRLAPNRHPRHPPGAVDDQQLKPHG